MPKIEITKEHIKNGVQCSARSCALALAIEEKLVDGFFVTVGPWDFYIFNPHGEKVFGSKQNKIQQSFIDDFDDGNAEPTTIDLDIPQKFLK